MDARITAIQARLGDAKFADLRKDMTGMSNRMVGTAVVVLAACLVWIFAPHR